MSSIRRVYFYLVSLITLGILAAGLRLLLALLFDTTIGNTTSIGQTNFIQQQLSLGFAMLVIGGPLWFFFWRTIQQHTGDRQAEIGSLMRQVFLNLILVVTALMSLFAAHDFLNWLIAGVPRAQNTGGSLATLIVTAAIWYYYQRIAEGEGHPSAAARTLKRWYMYIASGFGLVQLMVGLVQFIHAGSLSLPVWGQALINSPFWTNTIWSSISWIITGGLFWAFYWFRKAKGDIDSTLRQVYIYLLTIVGSSIAGLVALVMGLYYVFVWALGSADNTGGYFQFLGWVIPTIAVAAAVSSYHQLLAQEEARRMPEQRVSSKRVHLYIMSFFGLGTLIAGLIILLGVLLDLLINSINAPIVVQPGWWQKQLGLCLALLVVSLPLWWYYWDRAIRLSTKGGVAEWRARSRRIYLYVIIGAAIVALAADLVNIIYQLLSGGLTGSFGVNVLSKVKWSIQSLIVAAPLLMYHWQIARADQRQGAEEAAIRKTITILASHQSQDLISRLEERLGIKIHFLEYPEAVAEVPAVSDEEVTKLVDEIVSSPTARVMLVVHEGKVLVLPYQEK